MPKVGDAEVDCPGGRLAVRAAGAPDGPVVLCVPGLSANLHCFDRLAGVLARSQRLVVAVDLRGRGRSQITAAGTYGWPAHVADVLAVADHFGAAGFEWIGHSMGAFLGLVAASRHPDRVSRLVLIDAAGRPEPSSLGPIVRSIARLGSVHPSAEAYLQWVRTDTSIQPWDPMWEAHFTRELEPVVGGVRVRTDAMAIAEDAAYGAAQDPYALWPGVRAPTLLVRATEPMREGTGLIVSEADAAAFGEALPRVTVVNVAANHYTVLTSPHAIDAVAGFCLAGAG